jgi:hypothetical protein
MPNTMNQLTINLRSFITMPLLFMAIMSTCEIQASYSKYKRSGLKAISIISISSSLLICSPLQLHASDANGGNILTSPVLENFRRMQQIYADDEKHSKDTKALLLVPIVKMKKELIFIAEELQQKRQSEDTAMRDLTKAILSILSDSKYNKVELKRTFNRYSDNIFYSNPDEANLYLAGGTTPSSRQTQQYLIRNDIISRLDDLTSDLQYIIDAKVISQQDIDDALSDCKMARDSFDLYLKLSDPVDVEMANKI